MLQELKQTFSEVAPEINRELQSLSGRFKAVSPPQKLGLGVVGTAFIYTSLKFTPEDVAPVRALTGQLVSLVGCSIAYMAQRLQYNKHHMITLSLGAGALSTSGFILGDQSYGIMMGFGASRRIAMATIPNEAEHFKNRIKLATLFGIAGTCTMIQAGTLKSGWDYINLASMLIATAANAMPSGKNTTDLSHVSRLLILKTIILNTVYQIGHGMNYPAILYGGIGTVNQLDVINEKDIPNIDKNGKKLSRINKWKRYISSGFNKNEMLEQGMQIKVPTPD